VRRVHRPVGRADAFIVPVPLNPSMDRQTTLLLALGFLIAAALVVGVSGWLLLARDRRYARALSVSHQEATEES
jgi:hypothetical protein